MGPRIREDNEGKGNKIPRLRCAVLGMTCGLGRMSDGFPPPFSRGAGPAREQRREGRGKRGLKAGMTCGARALGMLDSRPVFTREGSLREQRREGWVPACARTREGEAFTPILAFPPQGGREG